MKKQLCLLILCAVTGIILASCGYALQEAFYRDNDVNTRSASVRELLPPVSTQQTLIKFALFTDCHFGGVKFSRNAINAFIKTLQTENPDFIIVLGDITEHGKASEFDDFQTFMKTAQSHTKSGKSYVIPGNHDLYNMGWYQFKAKIEPGYGSFMFRTHNRSWYFLDTASGTLGQKQLNSFNDKMNSDSNSEKLVFSHYPIMTDVFANYFTMANTRERALLINLFDQNSIRHIFSGHWHRGATYDYKYFKETTTSCFNEGANQDGVWLYVTLDDTAGTAEVKKYSYAANGNLRSSEYPL